MKCKFVLSLITAISLIVVVLSSSCAYRGIRKYDLTDFDQYYIFKVTNKGIDTIVLPYLVFQNYDICPNMMVTIENEEVRISLDLNMEHYFEESQQNMVVGNKLNYFRNKVPIGRSGLFFLPKCIFFNDYNLMDTLQSSKILLLEVNETNYKIPVNLITEVEGEIEIDSTYDGFIFRGMRLKK